MLRPQFEQAGIYWDVSVRATGGARLENAQAAADAQGAVSVRDHGDGTYGFSLCVARAGTYALRLTAEAGEGEAACAGGVVGGEPLEWRVCPSALDAASSSLDVSGLRSAEGGSAPRAGEILFVRLMPPAFGDVQARHPFLPYVAPHFFPTSHILIWCFAPSRNHPVTISSCAGRGRVRRGAQGVG